MEDQERKISSAHFIDWMSAGDQKLAHILGDFFRRIKQTVGLQPKIIDFQNFQTKRFIEDVTPRLRHVEDSASQIPSLVKFEDYVNRKRRPNSDSGA